METKAGGMTPALITMKSSQLSVSKNWNSMMKTIQIEDGKGGFVTPPMHAVVYNLSSAIQKNDKGSWYGWSITQDRIMGQSDKALYLSAKRFANDIPEGKAAQAKADEEEKSDSTPY
jgi:hypothetical protein